MDQRYKALGRHNKTNTHSHATHSLDPMKVTRELNVETLKMFGSSRNPTTHLIKKDAFDRA
jgi:hypothetical protein